MLEIACFNIESAIIAQNAGADRVELCEDYSIGGITPSFETISEARKQISIPLFVMIRPRGGNFVFSNEELKTMKEAILFCKESLADGVVFGILDSEGNVDKQKCKELIAAAHPMQARFH